MGHVVVEIGGRNYPLSCRDGDETHLTGLAAHIASKAEGLTGSLGPMSEARLLLMAALMVADELHDVRSGNAPARTAPAPVADTAETTEAAARLTALVTRAERLAEALGA